jgi:hypothetical protein
MTRLGNLQLAGGIAVAFARARTGGERAEKRRALADLDRPDRDGQPLVTMISMT